MAARKKKRLEAATVRLQPDVANFVYLWSGETGKSASWLIDSLARIGIFAIQGQPGEALIFRDRLAALSSLAARQTDDQIAQRKLRAIDKALAAKQPPLRAVEVRDSLLLKKDLTKTAALV